MLWFLVGVVWEKNVFLLKTLFLPNKVINLLGRVKLFHSDFAAIFKTLSSIQPFIFIRVHRREFPVGKNRRPREIV